MSSPLGQNQSTVGSAVCAGSTPGAWALELRSACKERCQDGAPPPPPSLPPTRVPGHHIPGLWWRFSSRLLSEIIFCWKLSWLRYCKLFESSQVLFALSCSLPTTTPHTYTLHALNRPPNDKQLESSRRVFSRPCTPPMSPPAPVRPALGWTSPSPQALPFMRSGYCALFSEREQPCDYYE